MHLTQACKSKEVKSWVLLLVKKSSRVAPSPLPSPYHAHGNVSVDSVDPNASKWVWGYFLCNRIKKEKMLSLTNSFHAKKNCLEVSKAVLIFPFFLSLPPCFMFYLQADRVGQAHPFPPDDISVSFCRMEVIGLGRGRALAPALRSHFCLSASFERRIWVTFMPEIYAFSLGVLLWITRTAPRCPRAASEGHRHALEQGTVSLAMWEPSFPLLRYSCLKRNIAAVLWQHYSTKLLLLMVKGCSTA